MSIEQMNQASSAKHFFVPDLPTKGGRITALTYCPYFLFVLYLTLTNTSFTLGILIPPYVITIFIADYFFEVMWKKEMSKFLKKTDWTCESNRNKNYWIAQLSVFSCAFAEVLLVYTAVDLGYSPTLTLTLLVGAKILGAPIQGWACDFWKRKPNFLFSMIVSMGTIFLLQQSHDAKAMILWLLLIKGFLGNVDTIGRTIIADERKIKGA
ncbi:MAG: hypothetical protein KDK96_09285 [Chlamydiia bacterium]|nr:hypothetical protein [Chlamydiia bacterium]